MELIPERDSCYKLSQSCHEQPHLSHLGSTEQAATVQCCHTAAVTLHPSRLKSSFPRVGREEIAGSQGMLLAGYRGFHW